MLDTDVLSVANLRLADKAVEIQKLRGTTANITAGAPRLVRRIKTARQRKMAQLTIASDNYTFTYARAMLVGTSSDELVGMKPEQLTRGLSAEEVARMEMEMESVERDLRTHQNRFDENSLRLSAAQRYVKRLLDNAKIKRFLTNRYAELLEEFEALAALETI